MTGLLHAFPAVNGANKLQKTSTDSNLFHLFICIVSLINHALIQLQARMRVVLIHGSLQVSGWRIQSPTFLQRSTTAGHSVTICSRLRIRPNFLSDSATRNNVGTLVPLFEHLKAFAGWGNISKWMERMQATFLTGFSLYSFHPGPCLQKCKIGQSTETNGYSVLILRGQSLQRTVLPAACLDGAEGVSRATCLVGAKDWRLREKMSAVHFSSKLQSIDLPASRFELQLHQNQQLKLDNCKLEESVLGGAVPLSRADILQLHQNQQSKLDECNQKEVLLGVAVPLFKADILQLYQNQLKLDNCNQGESVLQAAAPFLWGIESAMTVPWVGAVLAREKKSWNEDSTSCGEEGQKPAPPPVAPGLLGGEASESYTLQSSEYNRHDGEANEKSAPTPVAPVHWPEAHPNPVRYGTLRLIDLMGKRTRRISRTLGSKWYSKPTLKLCDCSCRQ